MSPRDPSDRGPARLRVPAPVDRVLRKPGLRLRHLPGEVCLITREVTAPGIRPTEALEQDLGRALAGDPRAVHLIKARCRRGDALPPARSCPGCDGEAEACWLDAALGDHGGLVVEEVAGHWCWSCGLGLLADPQEHLLPRLAAFDPDAAGELEPSLLYDTPAHPLSVQFEITTRCNLKCSYCTHRLLAEKRDVPLERFTDLIERIDWAAVDNVDFTGLGEPLLNLALPEMVRAVRRRGDPSHLRVVTNGTALTPKVFEPLCEAGITSLAVSIDSLDPERFARSRGGAKIEQVLANLEALVAWRERRGLDRPPRIKIKAVLLEDPYEEAERLLRYSAQLGIEKPHFSCLDPRESVQGFYEHEWLSNQWVAEDGSRLQTWSWERWAELGGPSQPDPEPDGPSAARRNSGFIHPAVLPPPQLCRWAVDSTFVAAEGSLLSCCETMIDLPRRTMGRLAQASMEELWAGELLWSYRLPLSLGRLPSGCVGCAYAPAHGEPMEEAGGATADRRSDRTSR